MNKSESIKELAVALAKAQGEMVNPKFDTENPFFKSKYASLAAVREAVIPVLSKHGLSIIQSLGSGEKGVECETMLMHTSGEWVSGLLTLPITKHDAQGYGSAGTYARRYTLMSFSGVVGDSDDDGNAASEKKLTKASAATKPPSSAPAEQSAASADPSAMSASQERLIRAKLKDAGISELDFAREYPAYSLTAKEGKTILPKAEVNKVLAWIEQQKSV